MDFQGNLPALKMPVFMVGILESVHIMAKAKTATKSAVASLARINKNDAASRNVGKVHQFGGAKNKIGQKFRQGDIYITKLSSVPGNAKAMKQPESQLAPGATKGSRHCLESLAGVTMYKIENANELQGPILVLEKTTRVGHPEHGPVDLEAGTYSVTYQRAFAEELRRVRD